VHAKSDQADVPHFSRSIWPPLLTFWVDTVVVVAGADVVELGVLVTEQVPDDDQDGGAYGDDGLLLLASPKARAR
jgi:hypothetical protein